MSRGAFGANPRIWKNRHSRLSSPRELRQFGMPLSTQSDANWSGTKASQHYRKLLIRMTSLFSMPLDNRSCLPSRDQAKSKMRPEANLVIWRGSPPVSINRANVRMVQSGSGLGLALKAGQRLGISRHIVWQELERDKTVKPGILGLVDDTHPAAAKLLHDAVMRDGLADHSGDQSFFGRFILRTRQRPVNKWQLSYNSYLGSQSTCVLM